MSTGSNGSWNDYDDNGRPRWDPEIAALRRHIYRKPNGKTHGFLDLQLQKNADVFEKVGRWGKYNTLSHGDRLEIEDKPDEFYNKDLPREFWEGLDLYRIDEVLRAVEADRDVIVYICEGERDVDTLWSMGLVATTNPHGALAFDKPKYAEHLRDLNVVILPDNDEKGERHTEQILKLVVAKARSVKVVRLPGLKDNGDATDWFEEGNTVDELLKIVKKTKPTTVVPLVFRDGKTSKLAEETVEILRRHDRFYDYGELLVYIGETGHHNTLNYDLLSFFLKEVASYSKMKPAKQGQFIQARIDPPKNMVNQVLALREARGLKPLNAIVTTPVPRLDGTILDAAGYDPETRLFFAPSGEIPVIPADPTYEEFVEAVQVLMQPFREFLFVDDKTRGGMLSAILTAFFRPVINVSPAYSFEAPGISNGKTLLSECIGALSEGKVVGLSTIPSNEDEWKKRITSEMMRGSNVIIFDNLEGYLRSTSLAALLTGEVWTDRALGGNGIVNLPNRALVILNGNNILLVADLARRVISLRVDAKKGQGETQKRSFNFDPLEECLKNRMDMARAACVVVRYAFLHGKKPPGSLGSFQQWDSLVRRAVCCVRDEGIKWRGRRKDHDNNVFDGIEFEEGFDDPLALVEEAMENDVAADYDFQLLMSLRNVFGAATFSLAEVVDAATWERKDDGQLTDAQKLKEQVEYEKKRELRQVLDALILGNKGINWKSVDAVLYPRRDKIIDGLKMEKRAKHSVTRRAQYCVVEIGKEPNGDISSEDQIAM